MAKKEENAFDLDKALDDYIAPADCWKAGLKYHIEANSLKPKNQKEFEKIAEDYGKITMGE